MTNVAGKRYTEGTSSGRKTATLSDSRDAMREGRMF